MELRCQQQQEALSAQLEAVEKAAKAERHEQQQFKRNLEREAREQTELKEKTVMDTNQKLASLQQHYKLLKSQNDDLAEENTKSKAKQLTEIKTLQDKLKAMQIQHEKDLDNLKVRTKSTAIAFGPKTHIHRIMIPLAGKERSKRFGDAERCGNRSVAHTNRWFQFALRLATGRQSAFERS